MYLPGNQAQKTLRALRLCARHPILNTLEKTACYLNFLNIYGIGAFSAILYFVRNTVTFLDIV